MIVSHGFKLPPPTIEEVPTTPEERAANLAELARYRLNVAWYNAHAGEIHRNHRGKYICVAGEELFVGDDPIVVYSEAVTKHPTHKGATLHFRISTHQGPKIYANRGRVVRA